MGLSKYIATAGAEAAFEAYVQGYAAAGGRLTQQEAQLAPELIILSVGQQRCSTGMGSRPAL